MKNLKEIKQDIIENVLDKLVYNMPTDYHKEIEKKILREKIENNNFITNIEELPDDITAESLNKLSNELYVDILTSFGVINSICEASYNFNSSFDSRVKAISSKINMAKDKLESLRTSITNIYMPYFYIETFRSKNIFSKERKYQTDRYGQYISSNNFVNLNDDNTVTLPILSKDNTLRYDNVVSTANTSINFQLGKGFVNNNTKLSNMENIIDKSQDNFYEETILSDAPFKISFGNKKPEKLYLNDNYYYGVDHGALFEMAINFESVNIINEITITPHSKYPVDLIAIRYKLTDDTDEELKELVYPDNREKELRGATIENNITYRFKDTLIKNIYLVFNQRHYERSIFLYNPSGVLNNTEGYLLKNSKRDKNKEAIFKPNYYDKPYSNALFKNINDRAISSQNEDLAEIIIGNNIDKRKCLKYEYQYGFDNIGCYNNHFDRIGVLVMKPISIMSNTKAVKIKTDEVHPKDSLGNYVTDIEYYITSNINPTEEEWTPIIPENKEEIYSEQLFITSETRAYFRFQAEKIISVKKNGESIDDKANEYFIDTDERTGKFYCIQIFNYDFDAIYSVSYIPEAGHTEIDFSNNLVNTIESFIGNDKSIVELTNVAFLDNTSNYTAKITKVSGTSFGEEIEGENITDITNPDNSFKNFDNSSNKLQFYIARNRVIFNKVLDNTHRIDISYSHLSSKIILKAIFRRNSTKDGWLTPRLNSIEFNIDTL